MSFNLLAIRELNAPADPLYPSPAEQPDTVELTEADGQPSAPFKVGEMNLRVVAQGQQPQRLLRVKDMTAVVRTTDARITVACSKYDKGGGWAPWTAGAVPVALAANAVSKARAKSRRQGKMLVGHIPYKWLLSVGYKPSAIPAGHDRLRLGTVDPTERPYRGLILDLTLPRNQSGADIARAIVAHAATRRLDSREALEDGLRPHLESLRKPSSLPAQPKAFASYFLIDNPSQAIRTAYTEG